MERKSELNLVPEKVSGNEGKSNLEQNNPPKEFQVPIDAMKMPTEKILDQISEEIKDIEKKDNIKHETGQKDENHHSLGESNKISALGNHHSINQLLPFKTTKRINFSRRPKNNYITLLLAALFIIIGVILLLMVFGVIKR